MIDGRTRTRMASFTHVALWQHRTSINNLNEQRDVHSYISHSLGHGFNTSPAEERRRWLSCLDYSCACPSKLQRRYCFGVGRGERVSCDQGVVISVTPHLFVTCLLLCPLDLGEEKGNREGGEGETRGREESKSKPTNREACSCAGPPDRPPRQHQMADRAP